MQNARDKNKKRNNKSTLYFIIYQASIINILYFFIYTIFFVLFFVYFICKKSITHNDFCWGRTSPMAEWLAGRCFPSRACNMGLWRVYRLSACSARLGVDVNNEFRTGIIDIDVFESPLDSLG